MPADVAAYAMDVPPANPKSDIKVDFQVIKFDPEDGVTVPHKFAAQPGEVIGEVRPPTSRPPTVRARRRGSWTSTPARSSSTPTGDFSGDAAGPIGGALRAPRA